MIIEASDNRLLYSGRIGKTKEGLPLFVYPATSVTVRFKARKITAVIRARCEYWDAYIGYIIDGVHGKLKINEGVNSLLLADFPGDSTHELMLYKRQDSCNRIVFEKFVIEGDEPEIIEGLKAPVRRIEVYGDSVSAGEVSEAIEYTGKTDPMHNGEFSDAYYSFAWMTARQLNARIHDIAQGGIALDHGTGWFHEGDKGGAIGMWDIYDKISYDPFYGEISYWDFGQYIPHVVLLAIGQNDAHPYDFMADDYDGNRADAWRRSYGAFLARLREIYPEALIISMTTLLDHDEAWDRAIREVSMNPGDPKIVNYRFERNGKATPGHLRISEAKEMADELSSFIDSFGPSVWES